MILEVAGGLKIRASAPSGKKAAQGIEFVIRKTAFVHSIRHRFL
jgi:hypothetical protein